MKRQSNLLSKGKTKAKGDNAIYEIRIVTQILSVLSVT